MNKAAIIQQLEQQCSQTLLTLLDDMFASCDDLFFDMASRATTNSEQTLYFESMREIRVKTRAARADYEKELLKRFKLKSTKKDSSHSYSTNKQSNASSASEITMALVDKDDVEQDVAISNMSTRARNLSKHRLLELHDRLQNLYGLVEINEKNNPLDPGALSKLFSDVIKNMGIDIKARIILLKQYERYVINRLPELYKNTCKLLDEKGIAFNDQRKIKKQKIAAPRPKEASSITEMFNEDELPLLTDSNDQSYRYGASPFNELSQLLSNLRSLPMQQQANHPPSFHQVMDQPCKIMN